MAREYQSFKEFYLYYLTEHEKSGTRFFHFAGTSLFLGWIALSTVYAEPIYILYGVINAYGFAWISHFFIEKNKPATFQYPLWSLMSDFKLYYELITGKEKF